MSEARGNSGKGLRPVDPVAVKLTLGIWAFTFLLFLAPQYAATGHVPAFHAGLMATEIVVGTLLSALLYAVAYLVRAAANWAKIGLVTLAVCTAALALSLFDAWLGGFLLKLFMSGHGVPEGLINYTVSNFISFSWLYGMLGAIYVILQTNALMRERERQLAEAKILLQTAQLTALRLQLNPHFLFNTLNAISSLIVQGRNRQGEKMLGKLCDFLRTALGSDPKGSISLGEELETLQNYLEIEAVRFGDRLTIEFDFPDDLLDLTVPNFILQPLVENAIKHGVAPTSRPVTLSVAARREGQQLLLLVEDDGGSGAARPGPGGTGVGLENVRRRLDVLYGDAAALETEAGPQGFRSTVRIPLAADRPLELVA